MEDDGNGQGHPARPTQASESPSLEGQRSSCTRGLISQKRIAQTGERASSFVGRLSEGKAEAQKTYYLSG